MANSLEPPQVTVRELILTPATSALISIVILVLLLGL